MKKRYRILSLALLSACLIGCSGDAVKPGETVAEKNVDVTLNDLNASAFNTNRTADTVRDDFCVAYADFALKLLTACRTDSGSDTTISPLSIMTALAMTANGADGVTLAQMEALFGGNMDIETLNQQIFNFSSSLTSDQSVSFKAANSLWVSPDLTLYPEFLKIIGNTYDADVIGIDFSDLTGAAKVINNWCNDKTEGRIPEIVRANEMDSNTVLELLNAMTFDAKWAEPYNSKYQCKEGVFHGTDGDTAVTMLHDTIYRYFLKGERETGFIKNYMGGKYAFVALLPNEEGDISDYLSTLTGSYLLNLIQNPVDNSTYDELRTVLPAFTQETSLDLTETLKKLGMTEAFDSATANFSKLGRSDIDGLFHLNKIAHKTVIEVNNEGTRAAAVTEISGGIDSVPQKIETVTLDRPFVYAIIDTATSLPIFIGSCENVA